MYASQGALYKHGNSNYVSSRPTINTEPQVSIFMSPNLGEHQEKRANQKKSSTYYKKKDNESKRG